MSLLDLTTEIKPWLEVPPTVTEWDDLLEELNAATTVFFETYTNRVLEEQDLTHQFSGNGTHRLMLREFPVSQVTRVSLDADWQFPDALDTTEYLIDDDAFLYRKLAWGQGVRNIQIDYTAGYAPDDVPEDLRQAALMLVEFLYHTRNDHRLGLTNRSKVSETMTFQDSVPKIILDMLERYRRPVAVKDLLERVGE